MILDKNIPIVVRVRLYRDVKRIIESYKYEYPDSDIVIKYNRTPIEATINGQKYIFVTFDDLDRWCKGRTYYDSDKHLCHSGMRVRNGGTKNEILS